MADDEERGLPAAQSHDLLRRANLPVEVFSPELQKQLSRLSADEVRTLIAIKTKLNTGLSDALKQAADTVGGFVW
jgi:hypothetical protein